MTLIKTYKELVEFVELKGLSMEFKDFQDGKLINENNTQFLICGGLEEICLLLAMNFPENQKEFQDKADKFKKFANFYDKFENRTTKKGVLKRGENFWKMKKNQKKKY